MRIQKIESRSRRDFHAIYECEHCDATESGSGYDDNNFHQNVIPKMVCKSCGKTAPDNYCALATKYDESAIV